MGIVPADPKLKPLGKHPYACEQLRIAVLVELDARFLIADVRVTKLQLRAAQAHGGAGLGKVWTIGSKPLLLIVGRDVRKLLTGPVQQRFAAAQASVSA